MSVEDITKDSGVAKGTFYHYFECKEEVVAELSFQSIQTIIKKAIDYDGDVRERCLYYFIELYKDASWSGVRLVRQWMKETMEAETPDSRDEGMPRRHPQYGHGYLRDRPWQGKRRAPCRCPARYALQTADEPFLRRPHDLVHDEWRMGHRG